METKNQEFFKCFNEAFARSDTEYIVAQVADDIVWKIIGDQTIHGKEAFTKFIKSMESDKPHEFKINNMITHGKTAAVDGIMKVDDNEGNIKIYAFCDIYLLNGFKNAKIKEMTTYMIETQEKE